jgi:hypothetical protein
MDDWWPYFRKHHILPNTERFNNHFQLQHPHRTSRETWPSSLWVVSVLLKNCEHPLGLCVRIRTSYLSLIFIVSPTATPSGLVSAGFFVLKPLHCNFFGFWLLISPCLSLPSGKLLHNDGKSPCY